MMNSYSMSFDGALLNRGFWLYIWDIQTPTVRYLYVGRTGDSSSPNAASPFQRVGQHLDFSPNAKGNTIVKRLMEKSIDPLLCTFHMLAVGPLFPEQETFGEHVMYRDKMATLETALADHLRQKGYDVLGVHTPGADLDAALLGQVLRVVDEQFPILSTT